MINISEQDNVNIHIVSGRTSQPWYKKLNPLWWFGNHDEPNPPKWYMPDKTEGIRYLMWYLRNPLVNFNDYVIGVNDKNYTVFGTGANVPVAADEDKEGWRWSVIEDGILLLPFVSYTGKTVLWYIGWKWEGDFGIKFNIRNSPIQAV